MIMFEFLSRIFVYALIPFIPAIILRLKFPKSAFWVAIVSTVIGIGLLVVSALFNIAGAGNLFITYASYVVPCSLPSLYCLALFDKGWKICFALIPSLLYFLHWFIIYAIVMNFETAFSALIIGIPGDQSKMTTHICFIFALWALFCIFFTRVIVKKMKKEKIGKFDENK